MFELAEVLTKDGLRLQGLISPGRSKTAIIYIHGLGGDFYGSPKKANALAQECRKFGFSFFIFNNRGSGLYASLKKTDKRSPKGYSYENAGKCFERFQDCVHDIDAVVKEAIRRGHSKIVLVGHSTGANKAVFYLSHKPHRLVEAAILTGPVSDVPGQVEQSGRKYNALVSLAKRLVSRKKGDSLMPEKTPGWPLSASRFLSLSVAGSVEDVFQYHMKNQKYSALRKIKVPVLAILGGMDEYAGTAPEKILASYKTQNPLIEAKVVPGAYHSFSGNEKKLARIICAWAEAK